MRVSYLISPLTSCLCIDQQGPPREEWVNERLFVSLAAKQKWYSSVRFLVRRQFFLKPCEPCRDRKCLVRMFGTRFLLYS